MKRINWVIFGIIIVSLSLTSCTGNQIGSEDFIQQGDFTGMGNPAAVYCQELGYEFNIFQEARGERGVCILPENQECDAWGFMQGECGKEYGYCAQQGLDTIVKHESKNGLTQSYAVCVDENQEEIGTAVEMMGLEEKSLGCGVGLEETRTPDASGAETAPPLDFDTPASFDWRDNDGDWLTPIRNQGVCGSCWAFAAVGVAESVINIGLDNPAWDLNLSEQYLVSDCQVIAPYQNCCGGYKDSALAFIRDFGIPDDGCMSYVDGGSSGCSCEGGTCDSNCTYSTSPECSDQQCSDRCGDWDSRLVNIQDYGYLGYNAADSTIKQYLVDYGPLTVSVGIGSTVGGGFGQTGYATDVYSCSNDVNTNHAVVIVGYEDYLPTPPPEESQGHWIIRNSWGSWNEDGYYKLAYGECAVNKYPYYATDNLAPNTPSNPSPTDGAGDISVSADLSWTGGDPNPGDTVTYDVYFEAGNPSPGTLLCDDTASESCDPGTLLEDTTYYWQVVASDQYAESTTGPVWFFSTVTTDTLQTIGMYSPGQKSWYLKDANDDGWGNIQTVRFGASDTSWVPVVGDWNGNGQDTIGMYSPGQKSWYLKDANDDGWGNIQTVRFGASDTSWVPVVGDWNGNGQDTIGMYSPGQKSWYLKDSNTNDWVNFQTVRFGASDTSWVPVVGDWNGNGQDTIGMYSPGQKSWYLKDANDDGWGNIQTVRFGASDTSWVPVVGDWNGNGQDTIGMYSPGQKSWYLKDANDDGWGNIQTVRFGASDTSWVPVVGDWN